MNRTVAFVLIALCGLILFIGAIGIGVVGSNDEEQVSAANESSEVTEAPRARPASYATPTDLARQIGCGDTLRVQAQPAAGTKGTGSCTVNGISSWLYTFTSDGERDSTLLLFRSTSPDAILVVGTRWAVRTDPEAAQVIADQLGGQIRDPE